MTDLRRDPDSIERRRLMSAALWTLADLTAVSERRSFRSRAFRAGSWAVDFVADPFSASRSDLLAVEGIGPGIADLIEEFAGTGRISRLETLQAMYPLDSMRMSALPRMTPGRLNALRTTLGVDTIEDLVYAIHSEAVESLEGIGPATADRWLEILALRPTPTALTAHEAAGRSARLRHHFSALLEGCEVLETGAVRRLDEWAESLSFVVVQPDEAANPAIETTAVAATVDRIETGLRLVLHDGVVADFVVAGPESSGTALMATTGPKEIAARFGDRPYASETAAFARAGRRWVPPTARQRPGGIPDDLVTLDDLRGDLHVHSEASPDGRMDLDTIASNALERGYRYIALTDHTVGLGFGGLDGAALRRQRTEVERVADRFGDVRIFHGAEINVGPDGSLDIDDETLAFLDFAVAGCHSHFDLPRHEQTRRVVKAISHPAVKVLAHPFGRRIGIRPGFEIDFDAVVEAALEHRTALEVNGHRDRMDLPAEQAARAAQAGVILAADSDAHRPAEFDNVAVSIGLMQRAHVRRSSVVNALPLDAFEAWLR